MPITKPRHWYYKWRLLRAVDGYPLYDPPHKGAEVDMPKAQARENFDYFMRVRLERLEILRGWMSRRFRSHLAFEPERIFWLDRWLSKYGAFLIENHAKSFKIFSSYQPPWVGKYSSYNVIFDIGIYIGEYVIARRPRTRWAMYEGHEIEADTFESMGYQRPCLAGFAGGGIQDVINWSLMYCDELRQYTDIGGPPPPRVNRRITELLKGALYFAALTEEQATNHVMPDLRNEPLE